MTEYDVLSIPHFDGEPYLMIWCPDEKCRWIMFVPIEARGRNHRCERCGGKYIVPLLRPEVPSGEGEAEDAKTPTGGAGSGS